MIPSIRQPKWLKALYSGYVALFFLYLVAPLVVVAVFAFNDSLFPSPPWQGFTLDWFFGTEEPKLGIFHDDAIMESIWISVFVAFWVTLLSVTVGTT
ncbi:MAG TPA: ABC transporter permease, partial [Bryobacterales bacterium]|nr:ABC transporter permease [Bryobacterales bacterium]